jgi:hypothetical protein
LVIQWQSGAFSAVLVYCGKKNLATMVPFFMCITFDPNFGALYIFRLFVHNWDRCYDHNFLRFSTIFGEKFGVFLKNQCYDQILAKFSFVLSQNANFFVKFFGENILKIITSVPVLDRRSCFNTGANVPSFEIINTHIFTY